MSRRLGDIRRINCKDCGVKLEDFNIVWVNSQSRGPRCRSCHNKHCNEYYHKKVTPELRRKHNLSHNYGITPEEYNKMFEFQQGVCAICLNHCSTGGNLSVDHDHKTGQIRGLLCRKCNSMIGLLNDDENILQRAIDYLNWTSSNRETA